MTWNSAGCGLGTFIWAMQGVARRSCRLHRLSSEILRCRVRALRSFCIPSFPSGFRVYSSKQVCTRWAAGFDGFRQGGRTLAGVAPNLQPSTSNPRL